MVQLHRRHRQNSETGTLLILSEAVLSTTIPTFKLNDSTIDTAGDTTLSVRTQMVLQPVLSLSPCPKSTMVSTLSFRPNSNSMVTIVSNAGQISILSNLTNTTQTSLPLVSPFTHSARKPEEHQPSEHASCPASTTPHSNSHSPPPPFRITQMPKSGVYATNYNVSIKERVWVVLPT